nr:hypothetical protein 6 [bacterium]
MNEYDVVFDTTYPNSMLIDADYYFIKGDTVNFYKKVSDSQGYSLNPILVATVRFSAVRSINLFE